MKDAQANDKLLAFGEKKPEKGLGAQNYGNFFGSF